MKPQILIGPDAGAHNADMARTVDRLTKDASYKEMSAIMVIPALGTIPSKVVASWMNMFMPPNQKFVRIFAMGMEVGEAYSNTIEQILADPNLAAFKYLITLEADNTPPPDGIPRLLAQMEAHPEFDAISGLYFTKGPGGVAQIWGDPKDPVLNFRPQVPDAAGGLVECCGTGMGFVAWRLPMFKNPLLRKPWFKTTSSQGEGCMTQDLYFWQDARKYGHRCAVDCSVRVGHYDYDGKFGPVDFTW